MSRLKTKLRAFLSDMKAAKGPRPDPVLRSVCISMVKNEQDVIEPFLRHNAKFFDLMVLLDNRSADRTREIALDCARELGNIVVSDQPEAAYRQSAFMTDAMHGVQGVCFADFVGFLDADEFIGCDSRAEFEAALAAVPVGDMALLPWQTHLPNMDAADSADPLAAVTLRRKSETPQYHKAVMRLGGMIDRKLIVGQGMHMIKRGSRKLTGHALPQVPLIHIPLRSVPQLTAKGVIGWMASEARGKADGIKSAAYQWKRISDLATDPDALAQPGVLTKEALDYAQDPREGPIENHVVEADHGIELTRKYSDGSFGDADTLIAIAKGPADDTDFDLRRRSDADAAQTDVTHAFDNDWHWDNMFLDASPFRFLVEKHQPASVFDVGCGVGGYLRYLQSLGVPDIYGVDGIPRDATVLDEGLYEKVDLQVPLDLGRRFDLVMCIEVVEHLDPATTNIVLDSIAAHATDRILFSMAEPTQPGNGHINCLGMADVLALWKARGWVPDWRDSLGVRSVATLSWMRRNLVVLVRDAEDADRGAAILQQIGSLEHTWYSQGSGIRMAPFKEDINHPLFGYVGRKLR